MQLNIYVPKDREMLLDSLDRIAKLTNRPKNEIILDALEEYLTKQAVAPLGKFNLGEVKLDKRRALYEGRPKL